MTAQTDPYVRVYYRIIDDPKFETVFDNDRALGLWLRLLLHADAMYPTTATLPHGVDRRTLTVLTDAGLVDLGTGARYRIHGLEAEREARTEAARFAGEVKQYGREEAERRQSLRRSNGTPPVQRTDSGRSPDAQPLRTEPIRTSPIQSEPSRSTPTPAGAEKNGSKNRETDEERNARYVRLMDDPTQSADIRYAAKTAVEAYEAQRRVN